MRNRPRTGFTLIELLVVVTILGLLIAILLPSLNRARRQTKRTVCMSNLRQIGVAIETYRSQYRERFPMARAIPEPWGMVGVEDPPLFEALAREIPKDSGVYACPGDAGYVHSRCGISYLYYTNLSGCKPEELSLHRVIGLKLSEIPVAFDFDGDTAETPAGEVTIPFFHLKRNLLFADASVGEYHLTSTEEEP